MPHQCRGSHARLPALTRAAADLDSRRNGRAFASTRHCYPGYLVPPFYDSLLAKVIAHAETRALAIDSMLAALEAFVVEGVSTTIALHRDVLRHDDFRSARVTTRWVEEKFLAAAPAGRPGTGVRA